LLQLFSALDEQDRSSLLAFAEFLGQRESAAAAPPEPPAKPREITRPQKESVVAAIKRLSKTYHMLDAQALFNQTASLMTAHIIQGRRAVDVIDELEALFARHYEELRAGSADEDETRT